MTDRQIGRKTEKEKVYEMLYNNTQIETFKTKQNRKILKRPSIKLGNGGKP